MALSAGLKERLKKCGRVYRSPVATETSRVRSMIMLPVNSDTCLGDKTSVCTTPKDTKCSEPLAKKLCLQDDNVHGSGDQCVCDNSVTTRNERRRCQHTQGICSNVDTPVASKEQHHLYEGLSKESHIKGDMCASCEDKPKSESAITADNPSEVGLCTEETGQLQLKEGSVLGVKHVHVGEQLDLKELSQLHKHKEELQHRVAEKEEVVRKLNLVKMYRSKNDLAQLERLISKWRVVSRQAVEQLYELAPEPKPSLTELVNYLHLDHQLIGFNPEDESFS